MPNTPHRLQRISGVSIIIALAAMVGLLVSWRVPGLNALAQDKLLQVRGPLAPPDDLVIVAIDEAGIARYGRFPWARALMVQAIDKISAARPRVITLDVLYSDASNRKDDEALAAAIARAGNVVLAAQLSNTETAEGRRAVWLQPLPELERAAAGVGHNGVTTDFDGVARGVLLRQMDDEAAALWALAVETVRVGEGATAVRDTAAGVRVGNRVIPGETDARAIIAASQNTGSAPETIRADRMTLDYLGPTGAFGAHTYSLTDVLDGRLGPELLRGKYVLIGATAASLGDRLASPFARQASTDSDQHAQFMPGVEVLANSVNTILRARFQSVPPDWIAVLCAALIGALVLSALAFAQGRGGLPLALAALTGLLALILLASYFAFTRWLIVPPLVPMLVAFTTATPLALLRRTLRASADLDERIAELTQAASRIAPFLPAEAANQVMPGAMPAATLIAQLTDASAVAIFARRNSGPAKHDYRMISRYGEALLQTGEMDDNRFISLAQMAGGSVVEALMADDALSFSAPFATIPASALPQRVLTLRLGEADAPAGALVLACPAQPPPAPNTLRVCLALAASQVATVNETDRATRSAGRWLRLPQGWAEKIRALAKLQRSQIKRSLFVDRALHSGTDGLVIAGIDGQITFANPSAATIFGRSEPAMRRSNLFEIISRDNATHELREMLVRLLLERAAVEREIAIGEATVKFYLLRLAAICEEESGTGAVSGIIATFSDITRQRELQQMKNDVMALVTHELRTPLTAIQGMSEVLTQYAMKPEEQHELFRAINDEAKRLARMIEEYLDITRIEAGVRRLHLTSVRVETLLEGVLRTLRPVAAQRRIRFTNRTAPDLPALLADSDLLTRAVTNLLSNAINYSPAETEITIKAHADEQALWIEIADQGYGIPAADLERIFEKFQRVARLEDAEVRGTGLGLALVREIAELHGGRVSVTSAVGVGSTFTLRLPLGAGRELSTL